MTSLYNTEQLDGKYLGIISTDFIKVTDKLRESSYVIRERGNFSHPIFIVSTQPLNIGALLIEKDELQNEWYYYASYLQNLVEIGLIQQDKSEDFKNLYKDPEEFCCLLVIDPQQEFNKFIYIPYPVD